MVFLESRDWPGLSGRRAQEEYSSIFDWADRWAKNSPLSNFSTTTYLNGGKMSLLPPVLYFSPTLSRWKEGDGGLSLQEEQGIHL